MYLYIYLFLLISYLMSLLNKKTEKISYPLSLIWLAVVMCFRYGQGTDYFSYKEILTHLNTLEKAVFNTEHVHSEIGFRIFFSFFYGHYEVFIFTLSLLMIFLMNKFITRYSRNKLLSLLLIYPTVVISYLLNQMRGGITIMLFLGIMLRYFENWPKDKKKYYLMCLVATSIHTSALILFFIPYIRKIKIRNFVIVTGICIVIGMLFSLSISRKILLSIPYLADYINPYIDPQISFFAFAERMITYAVMLVAYYYAKGNKNVIIKEWIAIYSFGVCIYCTLLMFPLISSRLMIYMKVLEVIIFPWLLSKKSIYRQIIIMYLVVLMSVMVCKNLQASLVQGRYYSNELKNYPYITIFNKDEMWKYRPKNVVERLSLEE